VDNGATEAEALVAAKKAAELLDKHNLTISDLEFKKTEGVIEDFKMKATRSTTVSKAATIIAEFTDTIVWLSRRAEAVYLSYLGAPEDAKVAVYLTDIISRAMKTEWRTYRAANPGAVRGQFINGMAYRLQERLREIKAARNQVSSDGTALVPLKRDMCAQWLADRGITLGQAKVRRSAEDAASYYAGFDAGDRVQLSDGIESNNFSALEG
jgi:hypothetical protein